MFPFSVDSMHFADDFARNPGTTFVQVVNTTPKLKRVCFMYQKKKGKSYGLLYQSRRISTLRYSTTLMHLSDTEQAMCGSYMTYNHRAHSEMIPGGEISHPVSP